MERREDVLEEYVPLDSLLFITCPILTRLQDFLDDPRKEGILYFRPNGVTSLHKQVSQLISQLQII